MMDEAKLYRNNEPVPDNGGCLSALILGTVIVGIIVFGKYACGCSNNEPEKSCVQENSFLERAVEQFEHSRKDYSLMKKIVGGV